MTSPSFRLLPFAALLAASSLPLAQQWLPGPSAPPMADKDLSSLVAGEFTGDTHTDAVVLAGGKPVLRESIETHQTYVPATLTAVDIAGLPGTGSGGRDQLVAIGPTGLTLLELAGSTGPWQSTSLRDSSTYWASAIAVCTGEVDGLPGDDIVAVTTNRVLVARSNGSGGWLSTDLSFVAGSPLTGVELVDWDGEPGGTLEIAVLLGANALGGARIRVVKASGSLIQTIYTSADEVRVASVATAAGGRRWLAAVATVAESGEQELVVISDGAASPVYALGEAGVYGLTAGDWDGDGVEDLVLGTSVTHAFRLYLLQAGGPLQLTLETPHDAPIDLPVGNPERTVSVQDGGLDLADADLDGDLDLVVAVQGTYAGSTWNHLDARFSEVVVTVSARIQGATWVSWHAAGTSWPAGLPYPELDTTTGILSIPLVTPTTVLPGATYEYTLWHTPTIEALAIPTPILGPDSIAIGTEGTPPFTWLNLDVDQHDAYFPDRYTLILRQVVRDPLGVIQDEAPALKATFFSPLHADEFGVGWTIQTNDPLVIDTDTGGATQSYGGVPPTPPPTP